MYLICSHAQQLIQQIENTLFFKLNSGFVLIQTGENDAAVEEHNTGTIRRRRPAVALEPRRSAQMPRIEEQSPCANCTSGTGTLSESVELHEQTGAPDAPSDRILSALKLRTARPPCEGPAGTTWRRGRYHPRSHRVVRGHPRRRLALFKTGNRPVPDRGRDQGVRRRLSSISPCPYSPRPSLPSPCRLVAGV